MQTKEANTNAMNIGEVLKREESFPVSISLNQMDKKILGFVDWHWHDDIQLCIVEKGSIVFSVRQKEFILEKGQGIFINGGCLHMAKPYTEQDSSYSYIAFDVKMLEFFSDSGFVDKYVNPYIKRKDFYSIVLDNLSFDSAEILGYIREICNLYANKPFGYEFDICIYIASIWRLLTKKCDISDNGEDEEDCINYRRIKSIMSYIHENYREKISLQDIADVAGLSKGECCRFFKRMTKCTIFEFVNNYRINKSIELLQNTDLSVGEIAEMSGFGGPSYYIESFKKRLGCTPKEYRNRFIK